MSDTTYNYLLKDDRLSKINSILWSHARIEDGKIIFMANEKPDEVLISLYREIETYINEVFHFPSNSAKFICDTLTGDNCLEFCTDNLISKKIEIKN